VADVVTVSRRAVWSAVGAIVVLTVAGVAGLVLFGIAEWRQDTINDRFNAQDARIEQETETFLRGICEAIVTNRRDARALMQRGDLDSGAVLVEVFSSRPGRPLTAEQKELVRRYQAKLSERQAAIVAEHEADDPDCAAEAAVRRKERARRR